MANMIKRNWKKALGFICFLILIFIFLQSINSTDKEKPFVNYVEQLNELAKAGKDSQDDASRFYDEAFEKFENLPDGVSISDLRDWPSEIEPHKRSIIDKWIVSNKDAFSYIKLGTQKPFFIIQYKADSLWDVNNCYPHLMEAGVLSSGLCYKAKEAASRDDCDLAFSGLLTCYKFGCHFSGPKKLIEQLVGLGIREEAIESAFQIIARTEFETSNLKFFQYKFEALVSKYPFNYDFASEELLAYESFDSISGYRIGEAREPANQTRRSPGFQKSLNRVMQHQQKLEKLLKEFDKTEAKEVARRVYDLAGKTLQQNIYQWHKDPEIPESYFGNLSKTHPFVKLVLPNFPAVHKVLHKRKAKTEALITSLALLRYKKSENGLPENLEKLVSAGYLRSLPLDPYSNKALVYKTVGDDFLLYSFGPDFDDDCGVRIDKSADKSDGDYVFWPVDEQNLAE